MLCNVLVKAEQVVTVEVNELTAAKAFEVEMLMALLFSVDILIAGSGLAVKGVLPDSACFNELVELTVDSCSAERSALC